MKDSWKTENCIFNRFCIEEAAVMKQVFESNTSLGSVDPTFERYPLSDYEELISKDQSEQNGVTFHLRKISNYQSEVVGYLQVELNAPRFGECWIPMLVFSTKEQRKGYGEQTVKSLLSILREEKAISKVGLNVYAENLKAFEFWVKAGFTEITSWEHEKNSKGQRFSCVNLQLTL